MCLSKLDLKPMQLPEARCQTGWKILHKRTPWRNKPPEYAFEFFSLHAKLEFNTWLTASQQEVYIAYAKRIYTSGFHVYLKKPTCQINRDQILVKVKWKHPLAWGWQRLITKELPCVVAGKLYIDWGKVKPAPKRKRKLKRTR